MSFWRTYYHLVWATKSRSHLLSPEFERPLYDYMVGKAQAIGLTVHVINGYEDHVHLVLSIPPKMAVSEVVQLLKGSSSHHANHVLKPPHKFVWQRGFGVFTLGETQLKRAVEYVKNQKEHHRLQTTNRWLETIEREDDAPTNGATYAVPAQPVYGQVREDEIGYEAFSGQFP